MQRLEELLEGEIPAPNPDEIVELERGVLTDQAIIQWYFRRLGVDQYVVASDKFLEKSSSTYAKPDWLAREIAQNFIDHNPLEQGTINGVNVQTEDSTFAITGNWAYNNPSGLISPHSDKPEGSHTAGGNGIGLKQVATIFLRDLGVDEFRVNGNGWQVEYNIVSAERINEDLNRWELDHRVGNNWLCARLNKTDPSEICSYEIVTDNNALLVSLAQIPEITVGDNNPFLQSPTYENERGAIVWHKDDPKKGRTFINGQVMGYKQKDPEDYWGSLEGVSLRLDNLNYNMSIDRAPMDSYDLRRYASHLTQEMSTADLVNQIKESRFIWEDHKEDKYSYRQKGSVALIEHLAQTLHWRNDYSDGDFATLFGEKLVADNVNEKQRNELKKEGYVLCPEFFTQLGAPKASSLLESEDEALQKKPRPSSFDAQKVARESGICVGHGATADGPSFSQALEHLRQLGGELTTIADGRYQIRFKQTIEEKLLAHTLPASSRSREQQLLFGLRTAIYRGLEEGRIDDVSSHHSSIVTTYSLDYDDILEREELWARNTESGNTKGTQLRFTSQDNIELIWGVRKKPLHPTYKPKSRIGNAVRAGALIAAGVAGIVMIPNLDIKMPELSLPSITLPDAPNYSEIYNRWKQGQTYGTAQEQSGRSIHEIVNEQEQAKVKPKSFWKRLFERPPAQPQKDWHPHHTENFAIVQVPSEVELEQLELLRNSFAGLTGYTIPNRLFLYTGRGTKGMNVGDGIGLHKSILQTEFQEAYNVLTHEVTHNEVSPHNSDFARTALALMGTTADTQSDIMLRLRTGAPLSQADEYLIAAPVVWDELRNSDN